MGSAISVTEILGTIRDGSVEVCATADADYDAAEEKVSVVLDTFARRATVHGDGRHLHEPWLPRGEHVTENLPREEVASFTKDVFRNWTTKVRRSVPRELQLQG